VSPAVGRPAADSPAGGDLPEAGSPAGDSAGNSSAGSGFSGDDSSVETPPEHSRAGSGSSGDGPPVEGFPRDTDAIEALVLAGGDRLRERMTRIELHLERVSAAAGAPLAAYATATINAGGKRLRPLLVVLAAESAPPGPEGSAAEERLVRAAAAVELVHSATLVHDDVIDEASLRRGRPTVVAEGGRQIAIATGDLLFSRAFAELTRNGDPTQLQALSDASSALAAGELLQREDAYAPHVTIERYLRRCELKTAALFEAACRLGALVAAGAAGVGSTDLADSLGAFARRIGLAFQILDDVLDVSGPVERTGKARGTDLLDGTVTLPLILARERDSELAGIDLAALRGAAGPAGAEELCDRILATGALEQARERALALVAEAKAALPASLPAGGPVLLERVADAVVARYR
jgi:geranylgeranyl pyrophosphate synthase